MTTQQRQEMGRASKEPRFERGRPTAEQVLLTGRLIPLQDNPERLDTRVFDKTRLTRICLRTILAGSPELADGCPRNEAYVIKTVESFFIHTVKRSPNPFTIYHTVWIGGQTIHATIALSGISQGIISRDAAGDVAAYIKRWGHFVAPGDEHEEDPPGSPERNEIRIDGCTFITFGLTAEMAEGFAVGTIYYFA